MINNLGSQIKYGLDELQQVVSSVISCHTITWPIFDTLSAMLSSKKRLRGFFLFVISNIPSLRLCNYIVTSHGGRIQYASQQDTGAAFKITFTASD